jgi:hypothetical protein
VVCSDGMCLYVAGSDEYVTEIQWQ